MWSWKSAWTGGHRGEETVGCEEEFDAGEEGGKLVRRGGDSGGW